MTFMRWIFETIYRTYALKEDYYIQGCENFYEMADGREYMCGTLHGYQELNLFHVLSLKIN